MSTITITDIMNITFHHCSPGYNIPKGYEYHFLSRPSHEQTIYSASESVVKAETVTVSGYYLQNILMLMPVGHWHGTAARPVARRGSCDEPPTKLRLGPGCPRPKGPATHARPGPPGPARELRTRKHWPRLSLSGSRQAACPLCSSAPTSAGCSPARARRHSRGSGGRRRHSAALPAVIGIPVEYRPAHQRSAQVAGRRWRAGGADKR